MMIEFAFIDLGCNRNLAKFDNTVLNIRDAEIQSTKQVHNIEATFHSEMTMVVESLPISWVPPQPDCQDNKRRWCVEMFSGISNGIEGV